MAVQYHMRAYNTVLSNYVEWTVNNTPDESGTHSGYPTNQLEDIVINNIFNITIDGYIYSLNNKVYWIDDTNTIIETDTLGLSGVTKSYSPSITGILNTQQKSLIGIGGNTIYESQQGMDGYRGGSLNLHAGKGGIPGTDLAGNINMDVGALAAGTSGKIRMFSNGIPYTQQYITGGAVVYESLASSILKLISASSMVIQSGDSLTANIGTSTNSKTINWQQNSVLARADILDPTGANSYTTAQGATSISYNQTQKTSGVGAITTIEAQQAGGSFIGGNLTLRAGKGGTPGTNLAGGITLDLGTKVSDSTSELRIEAGNGTRIGGLICLNNYLQLSNDNTNTNSGLLLNATTNVAITGFNNVLIESSLGYIRHIGGFVSYSVISPPALGAGSTNNNYNPTGLASAQHVKISLSGSTATIAGLIPPIAGTQLTILNTDSVNALILGHERATSTAANRFTCPNNTDCTIPPGGGVVIWYDSAVSRWRFLSSNSSVSLEGNRVTAIAGRQTTTDAADQISTVMFNPGAFHDAPVGHTRTIKLYAILEVSTTGQTCSLEMFNLTDGITVLTLSTTSKLPISVVSPTIIVGNSPGQLPNSQKLYGFRMTRTNGSVTDRVTCSSAYLEISYT